MRSLVEKVSPGWFWLWVGFYGCSFSILAAYVASAVAASLLHVFHDGP